MIDADNLEGLTETAVRIHAGGLRLMSAFAGIVSPRQQWKLQHRAQRLQQRAERMKQEREPHQPK